MESFKATLLLSVCRSKNSKQKHKLSHGLKHKSFMIRNNCLDCLQLLLADLCLPFFLHQMPDFCTLGHKEQDKQLIELQTQENHLLLTSSFFRIFSYVSEITKTVSCWSPDQELHVCRVKKWVGVQGPHLLRLWATRTRWRETSSARAHVRRRRKSHSS